MRMLLQDPMAGHRRPQGLLICSRARTPLRGIADMRSPGLDLGDECQLLAGCWR
jgi:hypothetical protein